MSSRNKNNTSPLSVFFATIMVIIATVMVIFTIVSVTTLDKNERYIFGYQCYSVLSDSMKATDFAAGDLIITKKVDIDTLKEGDIISFVSTATATKDEVITHKIKSITKATNGSYSFTTYGTTTKTEDTAKVTGDHVLGKYLFSIPKLGYFFQFLKTMPGYVCCVGIPFLVLILMQVSDTKKNYRNYQEEQEWIMESKEKELDEKIHEAVFLMQDMENLMEKMRRELK